MKRATASFLPPPFVPITQGTFPEVCQQLDALFHQPGIHYLLHLVGEVSPQLHKDGSLLVSLHTENPAYQVGGMQDLCLGDAIEDLLNAASPTRMVKLQAVLSDRGGLWFRHPAGPWQHLWGIALNFEWQVSGSFWATRPSLHLASTRFSPALRRFIREQEFHPGPQQPLLT